MAEIKPGITGELSTRVTEENSTRHLSGVQVFATPYLIALLEHVCLNSVQPLLSEGQSTVGIGVNIRHLAGTPVGMAVTATCRLTEVKRNVLVFAVEAHDDVEKVAEGTHYRAIVNTAEMEEKMRRKAGLST